MQGQEHKISAFADDVLFLSSPLTTLHNLLQVLEHFKILSNLKINYSKSFAMNISLPANLVWQCQQQLPFQWKTEAITYLGIQLPAKLLELDGRKFLTKLQTVRQDLQRSDNSNISWFGRAAIIRIMIVPHLLYKIQTLRISLPPTFFTPFQSVVCTYGVTNPLGSAGRSWFCQKPAAVSGSLTFKVIIGQSI